MHKTELQSFISKFCQLWEAGVQLGHVPGPVHHPPRHPFVPPPLHRGPAYHRRQERPRAARSAAATVVELSAVRANDDNDTFEEISAEKAESDIELTAAENAADLEKENNLAEKAVEQYCCEICDFKSN